MLKRYYTDSVTDLPVTPRQAWKFFSEVDNWRDWCSVIRYTKRFGTDWEKGAFFLFVADLKGLPPAPLPVTIVEVEPEKTLVWGVKTPLGSILHRFNFIDLGDGRCRIHQEEWSEGVATLLMFPVGKLIGKFNQQMADELQAMF